MTFKELKTKALAALNRAKARYVQGVKKSILSSEVLAKAKAFGIGHVSTHKDGTKWRKVAPKKWRQVFEGGGNKGLKAFAILERRIEKAGEGEMAELLQHAMRFCDKIDDKTGRAEFSELSRELQRMIAAKSRGEKYHKEAVSERRVQKRDLREEADDGVFGHNYHEFYRKGLQAVDFIKNNGKGCVKGAFYKDGLGDIDVVFGRITDAKRHKGYGIAHIIDKHPDFDLTKIDEIIKNGKIEKKKGQNGVNITFGDLQIGLNKNFKQGDRTIKTNHWIVTAYEKKNAGTPSTAIAGRFTNGANESANRNDNITHNDEKVNDLREIDGDMKRVGVKEIIDGVKVPQYDASEIEAAKDWTQLSKAVKPFNVTLGDDVKNNDFRVMKECLAALGKVRYFVPHDIAIQVGDSIRRNSSARGTASPSFNSVFTIKICKYKYDALLDSEKNGSLSGFHPKNQNVASTFIHEFGHMATFALINKPDERANYAAARKEYDRLDRAVWTNETTPKKREQVRIMNKITEDNGNDLKTICAKICHEAFSKMNGKPFDETRSDYYLDFLAQKKAMNGAIEKISGYAAESYVEAVAEAFADAFDNGNNAAEMSKEIVRSLYGRRQK